MEMEAATQSSLVMAFLYGSRRGFHTMPPWQRSVPQPADARSQNARALSAKAHKLS